MVIPVSRVSYLYITHPFATGVQVHPFDLHVLGMPPALILSQDQTLNKKVFILLHLFCSVFKDLFCHVLSHIALILYQSSFLLSRNILTKFKIIFLPCFFIFPLECTTSITFSNIILFFLFFVYKYDNILQIFFLNIFINFNNRFG